MSDLAVALGDVSGLTTTADRGATYQELIESLAEAIRRVERR